jgi:hypothetical protein
MKPKEAAKFLGVSTKPIKLRASDPEPKESPLAAYFRKMKEERKRETDRARKLRMVEAALKRAQQSVELEEQRRSLVAHHAGKRRAAKLQRTPAWANADAIRAVYDQARAMTDSTGVEHHVDHVIPLRGKRVSGLHVANNLQVIPASENVRKHNRYEDSDV